MEVRGTRPSRSASTGGSWKDSGTSFEQTYQKKSGGSVRIEARVVTEPTKADGSTTTMTSGTVQKSQKAQTYTPPKPKFESSSLAWGSYVPANTDGCSSGDCRWFWFDVYDLEPNTDYRVRLSNPGDTNYLTITVRSNSNGRASIPKNSTFYGWQKSDYKDMPMTIHVGDTEVASGIYMPE